MKILLSFLTVVFFYFQLQAQDKEDISLMEPVSETIGKLNFFDDENPMDLTLKYDISRFIRNKRKADYLDAEFCLYFNEGDSIVKNIRLKARGNFRRGYCFFPPIYLNFKTDPITVGELENIKKIKLVTHCKSSKSYQENIIEEYLAYRIYSLLTEYSFRVKLLNIKYIDTGKKHRNYYQKGFLIEPVELLMKRTNSLELESNFINSSNVEAPDMDRVALFQYMIGNTDWRIKSGHNMIFVKSMTKLSANVIPIPYDFDYSGLVDAHYALPQTWTSLKNVTDREYLGYCRENEQDYLRAVNLFLQKKEEIIQLITDCEYVSDNDRKKMLGYINEFYRQAEDQKTILNLLKRQCKDLDFKP